MKLLNYVIMSLLVTTAVFSQEFPIPTGYVSDYVGIFNKDTERKLELEMMEYELQTSIEIAVVVINDIEETVIEDYANGLFNDWGIGKRKADTGILIFLSLDTFDRGLRIEVGYGLEEFLTDYKASRIISGVMSKLKDGEYESALIEASRLVMTTIGTRSEEARAEYLAGLEEESKRNTEQLFTGLMIIVIGILIFILVFSIYRTMKARKLRKEKEQRYRDITFANIKSLEVVYDETFDAVQHLELENFHGSEEVMRKLKQQQNYIKVDLPERFNKTKKHDDVVEITNEIDSIGDKLQKIASELFDNHVIANVINNKLETEVENAKRNVEKSLPEARQLITFITNENPETIWRNFDYKNLDRNVEALFTKADQSVRYAKNSMTSHLYQEAKRHAVDATNFVNDASTHVLSVFDANRQINEGKNNYNTHMGNLPNLIESTEKALDRNHVKSATKSAISDIVAKYGELQAESKKGKNTDWIIVGALILFVLQKCNETVRKSSRNIRDYEEEEARKIRRKREEEEEASRRRSNSYGSYGSPGGSGGGGFSSFGGGSSGGGGSTGRF